MKTCRVLAGILVATLILYLAHDLPLVLAQTAPAGFVVSDPGCGGAVSLTGSYEAAAPQVVIGDLNGDGAVDVVDLLIFIDTFGKVRTDPGFNTEADFNCDGSIDVVDLLTFVGNFGS